MSDETIAVWIQQLINKRGIRPSQLAAYLEVHPSTVGDWLHGKKVPGTAACRKLALFAGVPAEEVLRLAGHLEPNSERLTPQLRSLRDEARGLLASLPLEVPVYYELPPAQELQTIHAGQTMTPIRIEYLPASAGVEGTFVKFQVRGDCMEPAIEHGDIVTIALAEPVQDGDVVAVETEGEWALRRYHLNGKNAELSCDNAETSESVVQVPRTAPMYPVINIEKGRPRRPRR